MVKENYSIHRYACTLYNTFYWSQILINKKMMLPKITTCITEECKRRMFKYSVSVYIALVSVQWNPVLYYKVLLDVSTILLFKFCHSRYLSGYNKSLVLVRKYVRRRSDNSSEQHWFVAWITIITMCITSLQRIKCTHCSNQIHLHIKSDKPIPMLPRWSLTDPSGLPLLADCQRSNPIKAPMSQVSHFPLTTTADGYLQTPTRCWLWGIHPLRPESMRWVE